MSQQLKDDIVYTLSAKQDSPFYRENRSDPDAKKIFLSVPGVYMLLPVSKRIDEKGVVHSIRYIKDCPTIDVIEQEKLKYKPNRAADQIVFKSGQLIVSQNGEDNALAEFMKNDVRNQHAPNRRPNSHTVFMELRTEDIATKKLTGKNDRRIANGLVYEMAKFEEGAWVYDEPKLKFYGGIFSIDHLTNPEIAEALSDIADTEPLKIINAISEKTNILRPVLASAIQAGVLAMGKESATLLVNGIQTSFMKFSKDAKSDSKKTDEILYFIASPNGAPSLRQMKIATEDAQVASLQSE